MARTAASATLSVVEPAVDVAGVDAVVVVLVNEVDGLLVVIVVVTTVSPFTHISFTTFREKFSAHAHMVPAITNSDRLTDVHTPLMLLGIA